MYPRVKSSAPPDPRVRWVVPQIKSTALLNLFFFDGRERRQNGGCESAPLWADGKEAGTEKKQKKR